MTICLDLATFFDNAFTRDSSDMIFRRVVVVVASFKATAPEANASADVRVTIETSLLWGAVGIGLIVIVLVGLWLTFRRFGRR